MKIICVGRNYVEHIHELNNEVTSEPVIFLKPETAQLQPRLPFFIPDFSNDIHHEVELVLKINKTGKNITEKFAQNYFDEIGVGIDFTARDKQSQLKAKGLPWELAKAFDGSAPTGKFLPKEKLCFYRVPDSSMRIRNFSISHDDTSVFFIAKKEGKQYLLQIHKTASSVQEVKNLLELDNAWYMTYPAGTGQLWLTRQKSSFRVFHINNSIPGLLTEKAAITGIFAADTSGVLLNYGNHVNFLRLNGTEDTLFHSPLVIKQVSLTESGVFIISTAAGVFYFLKGLTPELLNDKIPDGVIKIAGHNVWVLSDAEKKIYKYTMAEQ